MKKRDTTAAPLLRPLRLIENREHWLAVPDPTETSDRGVRPFSPFVLPRVPESMLQWCTIGGGRIWSRHNRCLAVLLLLGCRSGRWTIRLPAQRCGPDAACWTAAAAALPCLPDDARLGGTFQTRVVGPGEHPADTVPTAPGVHFVECVGCGRDDGKVWTFVRTDDPPRAVDPARVVAEDWAAAVDEALPRLRLA